MARNPGFTAVAVLTLALGIGATTTVFSVVYGVLFRPLPFPGADRFVEIVQIMADDETGGTHRVGLTPDQFLNLQEHSTLLHGIGIFGAHAPRTLTGIPIPARLNGAGVLPGALRRPGRAAAARPHASAARTASRRRSGRRSSASGPGEPISADARTSSRLAITLDDVPTRVVGIMPESVHVSLARHRVDEPKLGRRDRRRARVLDSRRTLRAHRQSDGFSIFKPMRC